MDAYITINSADTWSSCENFSNFVSLLVSRSKLCLIAWARARLCARVLTCIPHHLLLIVRYWSALFVFCPFGFISPVVFHILLVIFFLASAFILSQHGLEFLLLFRILHIHVCMNGVFSSLAYPFNPSNCSALSSINSWFPLHSRHQIDLQSEQIRPYFKQSPNKQNENQSIDPIQR